MILYCLRKLLNNNIENEFILGCMSCEFRHLVIVLQNETMYIIKLKIEGQTIHRKLHGKVTKLKSKFNLILG